VFLKLIELAENGKFHQIVPICIFNTFSNDLLFISGAFSIFDFRIEQGNRSRTVYNLVGFDLLPIEPSPLPFFDMLLTGNLELG
jgi:hypothetical protein